ncbi:hypothetical protein MRB53_004925 [Persea americana]|uniref:Uncharacterized protein n=1 Tax=Persea americana TaxID=3435 RepID=A0ACC2MBX9_PERAE|nr:hypothetical protein MRB53_004925 [Persea americana]
MAPATGPPVKDRVVLNPLKVAVHHGARFAAWKATMLIGVGNAMIGTSMTPRRTLQKPSTFQALCLGMKLRIGYSSSYKGFRCLDPTTSRIYITRHAQFDETHFPFLDISQAQPISSLQFSNFLEPSLPPTDMLPSSPTPHSQHIIQSGSNPCGICTDPVDEHLQANDSLAGPSLPHSDPSPASPELTTELPTPAPVAASHPMLARAKAGIFKPRHPANLALSGSSGLLSALLTFTEPKGFKSAAKNPAWLTAKDEEVQALQTNRTWILVPRPANTNIVVSKWVFRTKYLPNGSIERLKAHLVAKGYTQVPGLDSQIADLTASLVCDCGVGLPC